MTRPANTAQIPDGVPIAQPVYLVDSSGGPLNASGAQQQGQAFTASIGLLNVAASTNQYGLSIFNPANSGKNILIFSVQVTNGASSLTAFTKKVTSDPAFGTAATVTNNRAGGGPSAIASTVSYSATDITPSGTYEQVGIVVGGTIELLTGGATILLPAGSANGLVVYIETYAAGFNSITARWVEY